MLLLCCYNWHYILIVSICAHIVIIRVEYRLIDHVCVCFNNYAHMHVRLLIINIRNVIILVIIDTDIDTYSFSISIRPFNWILYVYYVISVLKNVKLFFFRCEGNIILSLFLQQLYTSYGFYCCTFICFSVNELGITTNKISRIRSLHYIHELF